MKKIKLLRAVCIRGEAYPEGMVIPNVDDTDAEYLVSMKKAEIVVEQPTVKKAKEKKPDKKKAAVVPEETKVAETEVPEETKVAETEIGSGKDEAA